MLNVFHQYSFVVTVHNNNLKLFLTHLCSYFIIEILNKCNYSVNFHCQKCGFFLKIEKKDYFGLFFSFSSIQGKEQRALISVIWSRS